MDFLQFEVNGQEYRMTHGTFRNKISRRRKHDEVELAYYSNCAFYTLKGHQKNVGLMTSNHMRVHNHQFYRFLQDLPLDRQSIHDIRLRFHSQGIWNLLSNNSDYQMRPISEDIVISAWNNDNVVVKIYIHKTDVVSIILGCSVCPIPLDTDGIMYFITLLARIEERLQATLNGFKHFDSNRQYSIPNYKNWVVTMWHFGRDLLAEYDGEKFSITVEKAQHILIRVYVKNIENKKRIRFERQEYPNKKVEDIVDERLGTVTVIGD